MGNVIQLFDQIAIERAIKRMAHQVIESQIDLKTLVVVGIQRRGVLIGQKLVEAIHQISGHHVTFGFLDITFYRDDLSLLNHAPQVNATHIQTDINQQHILLVDDVIYTGRTVRCAIEALFDMGRPRAIQLACLIDRGHRELPFRPDYVGKNVPTAKSERIEVAIEPLDDQTAVLLHKD